VQSLHLVIATEILAAVVASAALGGAIGAVVVAGSAALVFVPQMRRGFVGANTSDGSARQSAVSTST
jgi:hypothetical protein